MLLYNFRHKFKEFQFLSEYSLLEISEFVYRRKINFIKSKILEIPLWNLNYFLIIITWSKSLIEVSVIFAFQ